jgi:hypothetical protein
MYGGLTAGCFVSPRRYSLRRLRRSALQRLSPATDDWRGGRVAEGARLESVFTGNRNVGSNPTPSANYRERYSETASAISGTK